MNHLPYRIIFIRHFLLVHDSLPIIKPASVETLHKRL